MTIEHESNANAGSRAAAKTPGYPKNRVERLTREADMAGDAAVKRRSIAAMWTLLPARPSALLVPGHDLPMVLSDGKPVFVGRGSRQ